MEHLRISELLLWSDKETAARRVPFHPQTTVLIGANDTGKSSVLKSIYWTLGAEAYAVDKRWQAASVHGVLKFAVGETEFTILRRGDLFAVFDAQRRLIERFVRITSGIGPYLARLLSFRLKLPTRSNEIITPPPAYLFLPFYIDQDGGWSQNWSSFARLQQLPKWRTSVVEYHTGLKPNEYYDAKAALQITEDDLRRQEQETAVIKDVQRRMRQQTRTAEFDVSLEAFREQLDELLVRCSDLLTLESALREKMHELTSARLDLQNQRAIVSRARVDAGADYRYATRDLPSDAIDCPICGATYENGFHDRFLIAKDEDRLTDLLLEIDGELRELDDEFARERRKFNDNRAEVADITRLLETKREEISLAMVLKSEGRKEIDSAFVGQLDEALKRTGEMGARAAELRGTLRGFADRERRQEILRGYRESMLQHLVALDCDRVGDRGSGRIDTRIRESGSDQPRALLAYFFSILKVMSRYSTGTFCPIVIDSPNQQAQDRANLPKMLRFIRDNVPEGAQLVLGLEDDYGVGFHGRRIVLEQKNRLLSPDEFRDVREEVRPLLELAIEGTNDPDGRLPFGG